MSWGRATAELLRPRPLVCYRCLEQGYVRQRCTSGVDRGNRCFRCSSTDHRVDQCAAEPKCPLCSDLGRADGHVLGGKECLSSHMGFEHLSKKNKRTNLKEMRRNGSRDQAGSSHVPSTKSGEENIKDVGESASTFASLAPVTATSPDGVKHKINK